MIRVVISGLGVMGASLAMALKENRDDVVVYGYDYDSVLQRAIERGIIDKRVGEWPDACKDKDIVFLCTPIHTICKHLDELNGVINESTIVTDIGSTKVKVLQYVRSIHFSGNFIGGHPMTGAERSGINAANPLLYENAVYILTSSQNQNEQAYYAPLTSLLQSLKARVLFLDAERHDRILAAISHLPQLLAVALVNVVGDKNDDDFPYLQLAAGGFRDMTRVASSPVHIWQDIIDSNQRNIRQVMDETIDFLRKIRDNLTALAPFFEAARDYRAMVPKASKGFITPLVDVMVYVNDEVGVVARIANALSNEGIDIRDIELLKIREKEGGVFRLSFANVGEANQAVRVLNKIKYQAFVRE